MEIKVENASTNYIAEVHEIDINMDSSRTVVGTPHTLKPGESVSVYVWDTRTFEVVEVEEIKP